MGGRTSTTWKKGQSGNPKGRPVLTQEQRLERSHAAAALGLGNGRPDRLRKRELLAAVPLAPGGRPHITGRDGEPRVRAGLWALTPKAVLRLEEDLDAGQERASTAARYILDQTIGKPTETIRNIGDSGKIVVELKYVDKQLVVSPPDPKALPDPGV